MTPNPGLQRVTSVSPGRDLQLPPYPPGEASPRSRRLPKGQKTQSCQPSPESDRVTMHLANSFSSNSGAEH